MKNTIKILTALVVMTTAIFSSASAAVIVLDFEGIAPHPNNNNVTIDDYYNGGTSGNGSSGTNFGIGFSDNALLICLNTQNVNCSNTSHGGMNPGSEEGGLFFLSGNETIMNVAAGFDTGFSFNYTGISNAGVVNVYDGLNGTGNVLATINLATTPQSCSGFNADFCPFVAIGIQFAGIAQSVGFGGVANQIVFDDITFGSDIVGGDPVPLPGAIPFMITGLAGLRAATRKKKKQSA